MNRKNIKSMKGFTLLELIVVIAIIAILAVIAIPSFTKGIRDARIAAVKSDVTNLRKAIAVYYYNNGGKYSSVPSQQGDCANSSAFPNSVFGDPQVNKLILSLKNKLKPINGTWWDGISDIGDKIIFCYIADSQTYYTVLFNIDNNGLGICIDSIGFYNGFVHSSTNSLINGSVCNTTPTGGFTLP